MDLHLFLGRPLAICSKDKEGNIGRIPELLLEEQQATLMNLIDLHSDLVRFFLCSLLIYLSTFFLIKAKYG